MEEAPELEEVRVCIEKLEEYLMRFFLQHHPFASDYGSDRQ